MAAICFVWLCGCAAELPRHINECTVRVEERAQVGDGRLPAEFAHRQSADPARRKPETGKERVVLKPVVAGTECVASAWLEAARRRVYDVAAELRDAHGAPLARADGRYMPVPREQLAGLRKDLVADDTCLDVSHIFGA